MRRPQRFRSRAKSQERAPEPALRRRRPTALRSPASLDSLRRPAIKLRQGRIAKNLSANRMGCFGIRACMLASLVISLNRSRIPRGSVPSLLSLHSSGCLVGRRSPFGRLELSIPGLMVKCAPEGGKASNPDTSVEWRMSGRERIPLPFLMEIANQQG